MTTRILFCFLGLLLAAGTTPAAEAPNSEIISRTPDGQVNLKTRHARGDGAEFETHAQDELLVRFKDNVAPDVKAAAHDRHKAISIKSFRHLKNLERVKLPSGVSLERAIASYRENSNVLYVEPNYRAKLFSVPNDPGFSFQWNLQNTGQYGGTPGADIGAVQAWDITTGSKQVVVAVIDTGVDYTHSDLAANMWRNEADCNSNGIDDDGNGYVDDCYGIDTVNDDSDPMDDNNHGTHLAGIIGAVGNNLLGVAGINWNVKIMACRFTDQAGLGTVADALACLDYVADMKDRGINIVATNNSWGIYGYSQALYDAISTQQEKGILFIAAVRSSNTSNDRSPNYPASYYLPNVIAVGSADQFGQRSVFSDFGRSTVHLLAPGEDIISTAIGGEYLAQTGTSTAAAHVTGVAALLKAQDPGRDWVAIKNLLLAGGDITDVAGTSNTTITRKRLNAYGSLTCSNSVVRSRLRPIKYDSSTPDVTAGIGSSIDIAMLHVKCAEPNGNVTVTLTPGKQVFTLKDDGIGPDQVAGDGIYSFRWIPTIGGTFTLTFPGGETVTVEVDPDLEPGFPVKALHAVPFEMTTFNRAPGIHTLVGNIDNDPDLEIIVSGVGAGPLYAFKPDGSLVPGWPVTKHFGAAYPALGELSHSNAGLEVVSSYYWGPIAAYSSQGSYLSGWPVCDNSNYPATLADLDGDGFDEIIQGGPSPHVYRADGSLFPGWPVFRGTGDCAGSSDENQTPAVADLDGDGHMEIVAVETRPDTAGDRVWLHAYHHDGTRVQGFPPPMIYGYQKALPVIGNVDGDGIPEIVLVGRESRSSQVPVVLVYANDGTLKRVMHPVGNTPDASVPALADLDGDCIPEIIVQTAGALNVWKGDGSVFPGWPVDWSQSAGINRTGNAAPVVGDVDGDGFPDIVISDTAEVRVYNRSGVLHPRFPKRLPLGFGAVPAIADIDLDCRNEIIVSSEVGGEGYSDKVWVYDLGGPAHGAVEWGQLMGGPRHQGTYAPTRNQPGVTCSPGKTLRVRKSGTGSGIVSSSPSGIIPGTETFGIYASGTNVILTAAADAGSEFTGWTDGGCSGTGSCSVAMTDTLTIVANFTLTPPTAHSLSVSALGPNPGLDITVSPSDNANFGSGVTPLGRVYNENTVVIVTVPAIAGVYIFQRWLRDGVEWATTSSTQVVMDANHALTAVYERDATAPDTRITGGPSGKIGFNSATFEWTGTDNATPVNKLFYAYRLDPIEPNYLPFDSRVMAFYSNLSEGNYTFIVKARDEAGNEDPTPASQSFAIDLDASPPSVVITSPTDNQVVTASSITVVGTATDAARGDNGILSIEVNGVLANNGTAVGSETANWSQLVTLRPGLNMVGAYATDNSPRQNRAAAEIAVIYQPPDILGPSVTITSHTNNQTVTSSPITISGTATSNNGIASVLVNWIAAIGGTASGSDTANWSQSMALVAGPNRIIVVARDNSASHNATTVAITINYSPPDILGPSVVIDQVNTLVANGSTIMLSGTATDAGRGDNGISSVTVDGVRANSDTAVGRDAANWSQSVVLFNPIPQTIAKTITVVASDNSSNQNSTAAKVTINVQPNQPPDGTIISPASNLTIVAGQSVNFQGSGTDPDNNVPFRYEWNFGGGAPNSSAQNPGQVTFSAQGVYTVTFTLSDSLGLPDPAPAIRIITVEPPGAVAFVEPAGICNGNMPCVTSIQEAIAVVSLGGTIKLAQGSYHENLSVNTSKSFTLEGGWDTSFTTRATDPLLTVIDGNSDGAVFAVDASTGENISLTIERVTIRNGNNEDGGAISAVATGGGLIDITLGANVIRSNKSTNSGGGIGLYADGSDSKVQATLTNNMIHENHAGGEGGGLYVFSDNSGNVAASLINNTITDNVSAGAGGGVRAYSSGAGVTDVTIRNSIIWGNTADSGHDIAIGQSGPSSAAVHSSYNDIGDVLPDADAPGIYNDLGSNLDFDPHFINSADGTYRLGPDSAAIDLGTASGAPAVDFEGTSRPQGTAHDMGAHERTLASGLLAINTVSPLPPGEVGVGYGIGLDVSGGQPPYAVSIASGKKKSAALPSGLSLVAQSIVGMPTASTKKSLTFSVTVTDQQLVAVSGSYSLIIYSAPSISTKKLPGGKVGIPYNATLTTKGGLAPYAWSWVPGSVPGLSLDSTGRLSGTPKIQGNYSFEVQVEDQLGGVAQKKLNLTIK